jgi:hypothetical protein
VTPETANSTSSLVAIDNDEPDTGDFEQGTGSKFQFSKLVTRLLLLVTVLGLLGSGAIAISILRPNWVQHGQPQIDRQK